MRNLFIIIALLLILASVATWLTRAEQEGVTTIVWTAGLSEDRIEQVAAFHEWMKKTGRVNEKGEPLFRVRLEAADNQSTLIQAVSGMAGDLIDHVPVKRFAPMGVLEDITDFARENGLDPGSNYGAARDLLMYDNRQYAYACNLAASALLCNVDTFRKYGMEPPPAEWTPEEFEQIGLEFIRRANAGKPRQEIFFAGAMPGVILPLARSMGRDMFNETLTAPQLTDPAFLKALKLYHRWVDELHLIPTAAEIASESTAQSSVNNASTPQLISGRYAMIVTGRYVNMDLRRFKTEPVNLSFSQYPEYDFKNLVFISRNTAIFKGSKHKDLAKIFLLFLASREYNELLIRSSDGLPPNPTIVSADMKEIATKRPNEHDSNELEFTWARTIALPNYYSPYVKTGSTNWLQNGINRYFNRRSSLDETLQYIEDRYNSEIELSKQAIPAMMKAWEEDWALQQKIDAFKKEGKKIPVEWIKNPFYVKYYRDRGMLDESNAGGSK